MERVVPSALTEAEKEKGGKSLEIDKAPSPERAAARLKLTEAVKQVIENGLELLGVSAPEKM